MNTIKISGTVIKKEKQKNNDLFLNILIAIPLHLKIYDENVISKQYYYFAFTLFGLNNEQYKDLRKGNFVEIIGEIVGNSNEDGTKMGDLIIIPKNILRGGVK